MTKITTRVPVRADLAGGTLDLWPLYLFNPGSRTVNVAISFYAECDVSPLRSSGIELVLSDDGYQKRYASLAELQADPKASLIARAVEHFRAMNVRIVTRTDAPRGSGLGGSSALAIALVRALSEHAGEPVEGDELIHVVRDLETRLLNSPAGVQDYYPPVYGGLMALHLNAGHIARHPINFPLPELAAHFILHYTGVSHFSGTNNWEIYKRHIDGDQTIREGLTEISAISRRMETALENLDIEAAARALDEEWKTRKALIKGISTPEIDQAIEAAVKAGAWAGKVCGAGGGGCILFLTPKEKRQSVVEALKGVPGTTLGALPVPHGLSIEKGSSSQRTFTFASRRVRAADNESIEQLYQVTSLPGDYRAHALGEGSIVYDDTRSGVHKQIVRSFVAPINIQTEQIDWSGGKQIDPATMHFAAVPDAGRLLPQVDIDSLFAAAADGEETFREFLLHSERLVIFHNPSFGLYSENNETREEFVDRCRVAARQEREDKAERLESTFRRRIDQMKERSERDQRDQADDEESNEIKPMEVGIAWGQTLYNMTSGKAASVKSPDSPNEADYMEKIALLQKTWDRELEVLREDLDASARSIQEIEISPTSRNIEVTRYVILWAPEITND